MEPQDKLVKQNKATGIGNQVPVKEGNHEKRMYAIQWEAIVPAP